MEATTIPRERRMSSKIRTNYIPEKYLVSVSSGMNKDSLKQKHHQPTGVTLFLALFLCLTILPVLSLDTLPISPNNTVNPYIVAADLPNLSLNYYSKWNSSFTPVESGARLVGDHITLNATWTPSNLSNDTIITVNATAIPLAISQESDTTTVEIDTRQIGNNATCSVNVTTILLNGTPYSILYNNIFFGNFFIPHIQVVSPDNGSTYAGDVAITWAAWDNNTEETLTFDVLLSADAGISYQLLTADLTTNSYIWESEGFTVSSDYKIKVEVSDGIYEAFDVSDGTFTAGTVPPVTTPTSSTTTTEPSTSATPLPTADERLALFMVAAIVISAVLSLVVYYQARRF